MYLYPMQRNKMCQILAANLHGTLGKCHHYSSMYNIARGCDHGNLHILRNTSDYFNTARRQTPEKTETEWKKIP